MELRSNKLLFISLVVVALLTLASVFPIIAANNVTELPDGFHENIAIYPLDDSWVVEELIRNGSWVDASDWVLGNLTYLGVSSCVPDGRDRRTFLKFPLSSISSPEDIVSVRLFLFENGEETKFTGVSGVGNVEARTVENDSWTEMNITWNNQPTYGNVADTVYVEFGATRWFSWDVTPFVLDELAGDKVISICLKAENENHGDTYRYSYYWSKEHDDLNPHLLVTKRVRVQHDLSVNLDAPTLLESGDSSLLDATVTNWGLSNETDVELFLLVNGTIADSVTIPELLIDSSYTLSYLWTPTVEAIYNVTAYVPPVSGENFTVNNVATKMVNVGVFPSFFEPLTIVIDSTAVNDSYSRYHAVTIDNPIPKVFWKGDWYEANKDKVTIASGSFYYEEILDLSPGQHVIEYAVSSSAYYGLYWHATIEINGEVVAEGDCDVNHHLTAPFEVLRVEHDLAVALDAPSFLESGDSSLLDATVTNWGLNDETGVELFLLVDGAIADSVTIPELLTGSSYTLSYLWAPAVEAIYNVTAYVPPVSGENITANNVATKIVNVGTPAQACKIYVDPGTTTAMLGETFVIDVKVADVTNLFGFEYKLFWDPSLINLTSHTAYVPPGWEPPNGLPVKDDLSVLGQHWYAYACLSGAPFTGNLTLATYTFTVISLGSCALNLDETKFIDNSANHIPHTADDGYVTCIDTYLEGDINQDAIVDIIDIVIVALAFGSEPGDDNWDARADVANTFGLVDIVDIVFVAIHFGETG